MTSANAFHSAEKVKICIFFYSPSFVSTRYKNHIEKTAS